MKKDREGVRQLSDWDINNIEQGVPNYLHASTNIVSRLHRIMFELDGYMAGVNASGNSLAQRLEYWKVGAKIIREKPWFGYGTGDVADVFETHYKLSETNLEKKYQLRSHNQYLSVAIAVGIFGLTFFSFCLLFPVGFGFKQRNYFYLICLCISLLSFFSEDTLETQDGVFFFTFLTNFFLFSSKNRYLKSVE
ncbi:MAG: O-antigen ligase family protein [Flavobacteriales bacterium]